MAESVFYCFQLHYTVLEAGKPCMPNGRTYNRLQKQSTVLPVDPHHEEKVTVPGFKNTLNCRIVSE